MHHGGDELDPLRRHAAFEQRAGAFVVGERDAELQMGVGHVAVLPRGKSRSALILRSAHPAQARWDRTVARASRRMGAALMLRDASQRGGARRISPPSSRAAMLLSM